MCLKCLSQTVQYEYRRWLNSDGLIINPEIFSYSNHKHHKHLWIKVELNIDPKIWSGHLVPTLPSPNCSNNLLTSFLLTLKHNMNQYTHLDIPYVPTHDRKNIIFPILVSSALKMITSFLVVNFFKTWRERGRKNGCTWLIIAVRLYNFSIQILITHLCNGSVKDIGLCLYLDSAEKSLFVWTCFDDVSSVTTHCCCTHCSLSSLWLLFLFSKFLILEYNQWTIYYQLIYYQHRFIWMISPRNVLEEGR